MFRVPGTDIFVFIKSSYNVEVRAQINCSVIEMIRGCAHLMIVSISDTLRLLPSPPPSPCTSSVSSRSNIDSSAYLKMQRLPTKPGRFET